MKTKERIYIQAYKHKLIIKKMMTFEIGFMQQHFGGYYVYVTYWNNEQTIVSCILKKC